MKKFAISLIALAAISTASLASERSDDDRNSIIPGSGYATELNSNSASASALVVAKKNTGTVSAFERMNLIAAENVQGGH